MELRQNQNFSISINQNMQKFFSLLQLSGLELQQTISQTLVENPFLEEEKSQLPFYEMPDLPFQKSPFAIVENQINDLFNDSMDLKNAKILLQDLDERGFFSSSYNELKTKLNIDTLSLDKLLKKLQDLSPYGIFCFDLSTSFLIQAEKQNWPQKYLDILKNDFHSFKNENFKALKKKYSFYDLQECRKRFSRLSLQPLQNLQNFIPDFRISDFTIEKEDALWTIHINDEYIPKISFNQSYGNIKTFDLQEKKQVTLWKVQATELLLFLKKRQQLLFKILNILIPLQSDFLENLGPLKTCSIEMIAEKLNLHPTTIWRALHDKILTYPQGKIPIMDLITTNPSSKEAKKIIKQLLSKDLESISLTDSKIVVELKKKGIFLARRTVTKYRKQLLLPSSRKR